MKFSPLEALISDLRTFYKRRGPLPEQMLKKSMKNFHPTTVEELDFGIKMEEAMASMDLDSMRSLYILGVSHLWTGPDGETISEEEAAWDIDKPEDLMDAATLQFMELLNRGQVVEYRHPLNKTAEERDGEQERRVLLAALKRWNDMPGHVLTSSGIVSTIKHNKNGDVFPLFNKASIGLSAFGGSWPPTKPAFRDHTDKETKKPFGFSMEAVHRCSLDIPCICESKIQLKVLKARDSHTGREIELAPGSTMLIAQTEYEKLLKDE